MQSGPLKRREFVTLLGGTAAWPLAARAQQPAIPMIGFLNNGSPDAFAHLTRSFRQGLGETGYVEDQNVAVDYRWAEGQYDRLPAQAGELVRRQVVVIFAGGPPAAKAAKAATATIPIVFTTGEDPVKLGLVASLNRPGGNATGVSVVTAELEAKRLGLLHELVPTAAVIASLVNPSYPGTDAQVTSEREAARTLGHELLILTASREVEIDAAFATLVQRGVRALFVGADPFFNTRRDQLVTLTARYAVPAIYPWREATVGGGLMSYGASFSDGYRQAGVYVGRVLKGDKPADLPVVQSAKFELVINMKTAKTLSLTIPPGVLAIADEVIE
jgi:putative ABC transport system substrate-binding protein